MTGKLSRFPTWKAISDGRGGFRVGLADSLEVAQEGVCTHSASENNCLAGEASSEACLGGRKPRAVRCRRGRFLPSPTAPAETRLSFLSQLRPGRELDILLSGHRWLC